MADFILKMFQFLIEKFASASKYIVAAFVGAVLLIAIFGYFFGRQVLEPRIDYYLMTKINAYFEGEAGLLASARQVDPAIKNIATEKLKTITESLYDEVDAVYPISNSVTRADLEKLGTKSSLNVPLYVYADLKKHRVIIFLNRRQLSFDYKICFNGAKPCKEKSSNLVGEDITEDLKKSPLTPSNAGEESERLAYPPNVQLIDITPVRLRLEDGDVASLEGYVMVKRALQGQTK